jgi:hypothetical protein
MSRDLRRTCCIRALWVGTTAANSLLLFLLSVFAKNEKSDLTNAERRDEGPVVPIGCGLPEEDDAMEKKPGTKQRSPSAGRRIIANLKEAVAWAEGKDVAVRVTTVAVPHRSRR